MNTTPNQPKTVVSAIELLTKKLAGVEGLKTGYINNGSQALPSILRETIELFFTAIGQPADGIPFFKIATKEGRFSRLEKPSVALVEDIPVLVFPNGATIALLPILATNHVTIQVKQETNNNIKTSWLTFAVSGKPTKAQRHVEELALYMHLKSAKVNESHFGLTSALENFDPADVTKKLEVAEDDARDVLNEYAFHSTHIPTGRHGITDSDFGKEGASSYYFCVDGRKYSNFESRHKQFVELRTKGDPIWITVGELDATTGYKDIVVDGYAPTKYMTGFTLSEIVSTFIKENEIDTSYIPQEIIDSNEVTNKWLDEQIQTKGVADNVKTFLTLLRGQDPKYVSNRNKLFLAGYSKELNKGFAFDKQGETVKIPVFGVADIPLTSNNNFPKCPVIRYNGRKYNLGNNGVTKQWIESEMLTLSSYDNVYIEWLSIGTYNGKFQIKLNLIRPQEAVIFTIPENDLETLYF